MSRPKLSDDPVAARVFRRLAVAWVLAALVGMGLAVWLILSATSAALTVPPGLEDLASRLRPVVPL